MSADPPPVRKVAIGVIIAREVLREEWETSEAFDDELPTARAPIVHVKVGPRAHKMISEREVGATPDRGSYWYSDIMIAGADAALETAEQFAELDQLDALPTNTLSAICDRVSLGIRRRILLATLQQTEWNLSHAAQRLRFSDISALIREIRRVGLAEQYETAKRTGAISKSGHRARVDDRKRPAKRKPARRK